MTELGTILIVGDFRIFRANWSRTTPSPWAAWPASTSWTGEGPSEGATMAPEICRASSDWGGGALFDLENGTAIRHSSPALTWRVVPPCLRTGRGRRNPTVSDSGRISALERARGRRGCDDGWMNADIVIRGGTGVAGTGAPGRSADVAVTGGFISDIGNGLRGERVL